MLVHQILSYGRLFVLAVLLVGAFGYIVHLGVFAANELTLSVSVTPPGSGSVNLNNTGPYFFGDVVQLTAVPTTGYSFNKWTGDLTGSNNPASVTITGNMSITAHFQKSSGPTLSINPENATCRKFKQTFTVQVAVTNALNVSDFGFIIPYNATLLDMVGIAWNAWGSGTYTADEANGILVGYTSGTSTSGNSTLMTITFSGTYHHMWKDENTVSDWKNVQTGAVYLQQANLSRSTGPDLQYVRGGASNITVGPDFAYAFSPIQGDIDNNGIVDTFDLRTIAFFYDTNNPEYNLAGDSVIDILDIRIICANFDYHYT